MNIDMAINIDMAQVITAEDVPEHSRTCQEPAQCSERLSARRVRSWLGMLARGAKKADTEKADGSVPSQGHRVQRTRIDGRRRAASSLDRSCAALDCASQVLRVE